MKNIYQQMIIDHSKSPYGFKDEPVGCCESAHNPMCGDKVNFCVTLAGDKIQSIEYNASGCSISIAAASILTTVMQGQQVEYFYSVMDQYLLMLQGTPSDNVPKKLQSLSGVSQYPMRVKCASFAWHAAKAAIAKAKKPLVLTEALEHYWQGLVAEHNGLGIHLAFKQIGCMGWQFVPTVLKEEDSSLSRFDYDQVALYIDPDIIPNIKGTLADYQSSDQLGQSKVVFSHPDAQTHCGCGESFFMEEK